MTQQRIRLIFVIADAEHVRFVRPDATDHTLHVAGSVISEEDHQAAADHPYDRRREQFSSWVAGQLNRHVSSYDELVLVALPFILSAIRGELIKPARAKLAGTLEKDLTKMRVEELPAQLKHWLRTGA